MMGFALLYPSYLMTVVLRVVKHFGIEKFELLEDVLG
jgi:hypothetical protein